MFLFENTAIWTSKFSVCDTKIRMLSRYDNLVPRVLSYPPYEGQVGENPGNEVGCMTVKMIYKEFCLLFVSDSHLVIDCNISPHTAGLHQVIVSIYWVELSALPWLVVNGISQTSLMVGGFWSKALLASIEEQTSLSNVQRKLCPIAWGWWILLSGSWFLFLTCPTEGLWSIPLIKKRFGASWNDLWASTC